MANRTGYVEQQKRSLGDVAVDGLLAGMAAGVLMGVAVVLLGILDGVGPLETLGRFDPANDGSAIVGGLLHLAISGIYGATFAIGYRLLVRWGAWDRRYSWAVGAVFGLGVWLVAHMLFLPGLNTAISDIPPWSFALAHLIYGAVLGYVVGRQQEN